MRRCCLASLFVLVLLTLASIARVSEWLNSFICVLSNTSGCSTNIGAQEVKMDMTARGLETHLNTPYPTTRIMQQNWKRMEKETTSTLHFLDVKERVSSPVEHTLPLHFHGSFYDRPVEQPRSRRIELAFA